PCPTLAQTNSSISPEKPGHPLLRQHQAWPGSYNMSLFAYPPHNPLKMPDADKTPNPCGIQWQGPVLSGKRSLDQTTDNRNPPTGFMIRLNSEATYRMNPTRRTFFKIGAGGVVSSILGFDLQAAYAQSKELKISRTTETRSTCPYCSVSCGVIIHTL